MIALIDYGVGNLRSVAKALEHIGAPVQIVQQPHDLAGAEGIILPGVGAFGDAAATFRQAGFEQPLLAAVRAGTPLLGICVGLQLLFDTSEEMGRHRGLGIFPGIVTRFADGMTVTHHGARHLLKVPQIGWNQIHHDQTHPLLAGVPSGSYAYFVHSYYCAPADPQHVIATTDFGLDFASICGGRFGQGEVWGVQFHPEKSQATGLRILRNFVDWAQASGRRRMNSGRRGVSPQGRPAPTGPAPTQARFQSLGWACGGAQS